MAVSQGSEQIEAALGLIERTSDALGKMDGVKEGWKADALARLASTADLLRETAGRFFIKTKVCLPFTRKCEEAAQALASLMNPQIEVADRNVAHELV